MNELVAADIGGTHARFAIARVARGKVLSVDPAVVFRTDDFAGLEAAWAAFAQRLGKPLPLRGSFAVAAQVNEQTLSFTNTPWVVDLSRLRETLELRQQLFLNDFGAVGHAVAQLEGGYLLNLFAHGGVLPADGVVSIVGPGTGLGVAQLVRSGGHYHVVETEGGHIDFAPLDEAEDRILEHLRRCYGRVSVERLASGSGLRNIYAALAAIRGSEAREWADDASLWAAGLAKEDGLAAEAVERLCLILGSVAGDIALAQGAQAVVIAGGVGLRLKEYLPRSGFHDRFCAKGRFRRRMEQMPVTLLTHPNPGLYGAAAAFAQRHTA